MVQLRNKCLVIYWGELKQIGLWVLSEMMLDSRNENESLAKSDPTFPRNGSEVTSLSCGREEWISHSKYLYMLLKVGISKKWISRVILFRQYNGHDLEKAEPLKFCILICGRHLTIFSDQIYSSFYNDHTNIPSFARANMRSSNFCGNMLTKLSNFC